MCIHANCEMVPVRHETYKNDIFINHIKSFPCMNYEVMKKNWDSPTVTTYYSVIRIFGHIYITGEER